MIILDGFLFVIIIFGSLVVGSILWHKFSFQKEKMLILLAAFCCIVGAIACVVWVARGCPPLLEQLLF